MKEGLITFAGINSGSADLAAGKNEHLRSFKVTYPPKRRTSSTKSDSSAGDSKDGSIEPIGKAALFTPSKDAKSEVYQRVLRLSPVQRRDTPSKRIGAAATGLAGEASEVVVFDATFSDPSARHRIATIWPEGGAEAADVAIAELKKELFSLVYCTEHDVYATTINYDFEAEKARGGAPAQPRTVYTVPHSHSKAAVSRPTFRALRFLTPDYLLLLLNLPARSGAELVILRLYPSSSGEVVARKRLPKRIKAATGLDVCLLDADPKTGERQIVVAVVGQDITVEVYTVDFLGTKKNAMGELHSYITLRDSHPYQMTGVAFSPFHPPRAASSAASTAERNPQYLRLATVSMGSTVVVDHFQLTEVSAAAASSSTSAAAGGGSVRYVLSTARARFIYSSSIVFLIGAITLVSAVLLQAVLQSPLMGGDESSGNATQLSMLRDRAQSFVFGPKPAVPSILPSSSSLADSSMTSPSVPPSPLPQKQTKNLRALLAERSSSSSSSSSSPESQQKLILRPRTGTNPSADVEGDIAVHMHADLDADANNNNNNNKKKKTHDRKPKAVIPDDTQEVQELQEVQDGKDGYEEDDEGDNTDKRSNRYEEDAGFNSDGEDLKPWQDLSEHARAWWTERLRRAEAWAVEEGEAVLRGVLFAEVAAGLEG